MVIIELVMADSEGESLNGTGSYFSYWRMILVFARESYPLSIILRHFSISSESFNSPWMEFHG